MQVIARQPHAKKSRDVGLAETRYSSPEETAQRQTIAKRIRERASLNESNMRLAGYAELDRRRKMLRSQADRFETCGLEYAVVRCRECKQPYAGRRRCESRICESCARKFGARIRKRQTEMVSKLQPTKYKRWALLTLTQKSNPRYWPTPNHVRRLFKNARKLINTLWPKHMGCGAFAAFEVGKNHNLHVHVLLYGHYVPQNKIADLWEELTGNSRIVDIREVRGAKKGVVYVLKYVTKPKKFSDPKETARYLELLLGVRRIHTYGILYGGCLIPNAGYPCPLCGGKLQFRGFDPGPSLPKTTLFFEEVSASDEPAKGVN